MKNDGLRSWRGKYSQPLLKICGPTWRSWTATSKRMNPRYDFWSLYSRTCVLTTGGVIVYRDRSSARCGGPALTYQPQGMKASSNWACTLYQKGSCGTNWLIYSKTPTPYFLGTSIRPIGRSLRRAIVPVRNRSLEQVVLQESVRTGLRPVQTLDQMGRIELVNMLQEHQRRLMSGLRVRSDAKSATLNAIASIERFLAGAISD